MLCACANQDPIVPTVPADTSSEQELTGENIEYSYYLPFSDQYNSIAMIIDLGSTKADAMLTIDQIVDKYFPPSTLADNIKAQLKEADCITVGDNGYYLFLPRYQGTTFSVCRTKNKKITEEIYNKSNPFILIADRQNISVCVKVDYNGTTDIVYPTAFAEGTQIYGQTNHFYDATSVCRAEDVSVMDTDFSQQLISIASGKLLYDLEDKGTANPDAIWQAVLCAASYNVGSAYYNEQDNIVLYADELSLYSEVLYGLPLTALPSMPNNIACEHIATDDAYIFVPIQSQTYAFTFSEQIATDTGCILYIDQCEGNIVKKTYRTDWEYAENGLGMRLVKISDK